MLGLPLWCDAIVTNKVCVKSNDGEMPLSSGEVSVRLTTGVMQLANGSRSETDIGGLMLHHGVMRC